MIMRSIFIIIFLNFFRTEVIIPTKDILIFILIVLIILDNEFGIIKYLYIWNFDALKDSNNFILLSSVKMKLWYIFIIVIITEISKAIIIIDFWFAPAIIIIIGPSATLGKLLNIVK